MMQINLEDTLKYFYSKGMHNRVISNLDYAELFDPISDFTSVEIFVEEELKGITAQVSDAEDYYYKDYSIESEKDLEVIYKDFHSKAFKSMYNK